MPNPKTDPLGFSTNNSDEQRDMGAKGGPSTELGMPDSKHGISAPYDEDLTTQMAVKGKNNHKDKRSSDKAPANKTPGNSDSNKTPGKAGNRTSSPRSSL